MAASHLYRDKYRRMMLYLCGLSISTVVLLFLFILQLMTTPKPHYFSTTAAGDTQPLHSLDMPVVSQHFLFKWATTAVNAAYNLHFDTYQDDLKKASQYFTANGWAAFTKAIQTSGVLDNLIQKKLIMSAIANGPPVILSEAVVHGRYTWQVQLPLFVTYTSASEQEQLHFIVTMNIMRVPVVEKSGDNNQDVPESIQINDFDVSRK